MGDKGAHIIGIFVLTIMGWAMTAILSQMKDNEIIIDALGNRISILETQLHYHEGETHE